MDVEGIIVSGTTGTLKKLVSVINSEISLFWGVKDELKKLKDTLELITVKTSDAEAQQENNCKVSLWLKRLKGAAYDADDLLDEFSYEDLRRSEKQSSSKKGSSKVKEFFSSSNPVASRFKMAHKIKAINKQFNQISTDMQRFCFQSTNNETSRYDEQIIAEKRYRLTASFFGDDTKIVGRDHDKSEIAKLLTPSVSSSAVSSSQQERVSVISIVGMGGQGKTTLAQSVFKLVEKHFKKTLCVCVSDEFDFYKILLNIVESATNSKCPEFSNINVLVDKVKEQLENTLYLLVLDDLWNEDSMEWDKLKGVLDVGAVGSRIIVTTRKQEVLSVVRGVIPPYNLGVISDTECWSIIKSKAFSPGGASATPNMMSIGEQVAKKCGGLPLAATFLGGLMHSHSDERYWLSIRDNKSLQSDGIMPILKLSYDNLPSHLKQCFSYCCLFPKDWVFDRETLINLWMAEGFLHTPNGGNQKSLEDIGNDYFLHLLSNSFFHDVEKDLLGDIQRFKMHDLVHDLAQSVVASHEVAILNASEMQNDVSQVRRLQLMEEGEASTSVSNVLVNAKKLRTFFYHDRSFSSWSPLYGKRLRVMYPLRSKYNSILYSLFPSPFIHFRYLDLSYSIIKDADAASISQLYHLQTLNLYHSKNVQMVVNIIGSLRNLRHLNLIGSDAEVLPDSILGLTNLHTLNIRYTKITELPINIGSLQNLRTLVISFTKIRELPDSITRIHNLKRLELDCCEELSGLPCDFGALTQLRSLDVTDTGITELPESLADNVCKLESVMLGWNCAFPKDIKNWVELRCLSMYKGETPRGIEKLTKLETLLDYSVRKEEDCIRNNFSGGIEELANLNSLRRLGIEQLQNVRGGKMEAERAKLQDKQNIRKLNLFWAKEKEEEEELGNINNSYAVLDGLQPHPNLKDMRIVGYSGLKFPKWLTSSFCLPNLVELKLFDCYRCEELPALGMLPCLKFLEIRGMGSVKSLGKEFHYQEEEEEGKGSAIATSSFPSLIELKIVDMKQLEEWVAPPPPHNSFPLLEQLYLEHCYVLTSVPDLRLWTSLREINISNCDKLRESLPYDIPLFIRSHTNTC